jgi:site-specific DNA recombinase
MNGVIYCRVSSKEQIEGTSLESQELACQEYARQRHIKILKIFVERGESAKFADREQLLELIDFCKENKGQVQTLLVWKVDRFARNVGDHFNIKAILLKYGVQVVSVTEPIDAKPEGKLMETILAGFAQFDNDIRAMRTVQGMRRKIQEGIFPWGPPLGYKSSVTNGEKKTQPDKPAQPIFSLLQKAWKEFASGGYTKTEMQRLLTARGVRTAKGHPLSLQSVDNLFRNPYYAGVLVDPWSREEHEGKHVPMVSREEFARAQQKSVRRNHSEQHRKERSEFPLRGLVRCPDCSLYMTASFSRGRSRRYPYYRCANINCSPRKSYRAEGLHDQFETFLDAIAPGPEVFKKIGDYVLQVAEDRQGLRKSMKTRKDAELDGLQREIQELISVRISGLITDQEFAAQKNVLVQRRTNIEATLDSESLNPKAILREIGEITKPLSELMQTWQVMEPAFRPRFNRLLLPVGYVSGEIRTAERGLLFRSFGEVSEAKTNGVPLKGENLNRLIQEIQAFAELFRFIEEGKGLPESGSRRYMRITLRPQT